MSVYTTYSDGELVAFLQTGDGKAFEEIYKRYWKKMFYKAAQKLQNQSLAEELVQDIFMDLWKRRDTLKIETSIDYYLAGALKFRIISQQAKEYREAAYLRSVGATEQDDSTQQQLRMRELRQRLALLVERLPEKCRLAYQLREDGLSQREISWKMNVSENTVETHIARALRALRTGLQNFFF